MLTKVAKPKNIHYSISQVQIYDILTTLLKSAYDVHPTNRPFPNKPIDAENKIKLGEK